MSIMIDDFSNWLTENDLMLNEDKKAPCFFSLRVAEDAGSGGPVRYLGVLADRKLTSRLLNPNTFFWN